MLIYALQVHLVPSLYTWINTEYVLHGAWISRTHTPVQSIQPLSETHSQIIHINGKWFIYVAPLIQGAFHRYSFTHSHTGGGGNHARHQLAHREQLGVQSLAQGLFETNSGGARDWTENFLGTLRVPMRVSHCRPDWHQDQNASLLCALFSNFN